MPHLSNYEVFGTKLVDTTVSTSIDKEVSIYRYIKVRAPLYLWQYCRFENKFQSGIPDIILFRGNEYWWIECKLLKQKTLKSIQDSLTWQFGQLAFMVEAFKRKSKYILAVGQRPNKLTFYMGEYNGIENFPDFIRQL